MQCLKVLFQAEPGRFGGNRLNFGGKRKRATLMILLRNHRSRWEKTMKHRWLVIGETLWYRLVVGGNFPRYVRLRPRASLANILDERSDQALPDEVNRSISRMTVETLNLRPDMLVNVTPESGH